MTSEKRDGEIAAWLTANANQGNFTIEDVHRFSVIGRATVCAWIGADEVRKRFESRARWEWVHVFENAGASVVYRSTDPGQP